MLPRSDDDDVDDKILILMLQKDKIDILGECSVFW